MPKQIVGDFVRFTLAYNPGAAFSMSLGHPNVSRWVFGSFAAIALVVLWQIYRSSAEADKLRVAAVALAWAGAAGNLIDRITSTRGVVDFIDVGVGSTRFWTFNVADSGVSVGAVCLAIMLWREDAAQRRIEEAQKNAPPLPVAVPVETLQTLAPTTVDGPPPHISFEPGFGPAPVTMTADAPPVAPVDDSIEGERGG